MCAADLLNNAKCLTDLHKFHVTVQCMSDIGKTQEQTQKSQERSVKPKKDPKTSDSRENLGQTHKTQHRPVKPNWQGNEMRRG